MDKITITGGRPLRGEIVVSGAKNAALPLMASALLSRGTLSLSNVPELKDVSTMASLLKTMGASVTVSGRTVILDAAELKNIEAPYEMVKTMRASILVLGPLVARLGEARVSLPGGCAIGARPINLHLSGLERMGADVVIEHGYVHVKAARLKGAPIYLDSPTVTGTENLMMAATLADGRTTIENAACEPEIADLAASLNSRGARISGAGSRVISIDGVLSLDSGEHIIMPDRIEAGTFLVAGAITQGDLFIRGARAGDMEALLIKLREAGVALATDDKGIRSSSARPVTAVDIKTLPYPGFPTDMQAQFMALMTVASGLSVISETVFESRFTHVAELRRMRASIRIQGNNALVEGVGHLSGAPVMASDLRASASLVLAGLAAKGETEISRIYHLDRGYERIEEKLAAVGGHIVRTEGAP